MFSPLTLFITKYYKGSGYTNLKYMFGVAQNPLEARLNFPPRDEQDVSFTYGCYVKPITIVDRHFVAVVPQNRIQKILSDTNIDKERLDAKKLFFTIYENAPDRHGFFTAREIDFFVSDSHTHFPQRFPYVDQKPIDDITLQLFIRAGKLHEDYELIESNEVNVDGYVIIPCKLREYNISSLNPFKALERWNKRRAVEQEAHKPGALGYEYLCFDNLEKELNFLSRRKSNEDSKTHKEFKVLDLGCGTLSNGWVAVVEKGLVPPQSMYGLEIDEDTLFAGRCVYGEDLARYGFDWSQQVRRGDALDMPYENETFDFIMAVNSLENIVNTEKGILREDRNQNGRKLFKEMSRVLKKDGQLYLSTFDFEYHKDMFAFSSDELVYSMEGAGFYFVPWLHLKHIDYPHTDSEGKSTGETKHMLSFCIYKDK